MMEERQQRSSCFTVAGGPVGLRDTALSPRADKRS